MADAASVHHLLRAKFENGRVFSAAFPILPLPVNMSFKRAVARFTANSRLGHRCGVGVMDLVVILTKISVVTGGAHAVPIHAPPCPMAPLTGMPIVVSKDIEPLVSFSIVGDFEGLQASSGEIHQELAQRVPSNYTLDFESPRTGLNGPGNALS